MSNTRDSKILHPKKVKPVLTELEQDEVDYVDIPDELRELVLHYIQKRRGKGRSPFGSFFGLRMWLVHINKPATDEELNTIFKGAETCLHGFYDCVDYSIIKKNLTRGRNHE